MTKDDFQLIVGRARAAGLALKRRARSLMKAIQAEAFRPLLVATGLSGQLFGLRRAARDREYGIWDMERNCIGDRFAVVRIADDLRLDGAPEP